MADFNDQGVLTIPITKSAPAPLPGATAATWLNQNWPVVMLVGVGLLALTLAKPAR